MTDYVADKKICAGCWLRTQCTRSKLGRSVARHWQEAKLEVALAFARLPEAQADRHRRRHLMEGSFAQGANCHHFKRARWRRLWRQQIQDWLIAAVQNIALLCGATGAGVEAVRPGQPKTGASKAGIFAIRASAVLNASDAIPGYFDRRGEFISARSSKVGDAITSLLSSPFGQRTLKT